MDPKDPSKTPNTQVPPVTPVSSQNSDGSTSVASSDTTKSPSSQTQPQSESSSQTAPAASFGAEMTPGSISQTETSPTSQLENPVTPSPKSSDLSNNDIGKVTAPPSTSQATAPNAPSNSTKGTTSEKLDQFVNEINSDGDVVPSAKNVVSGGDLSQKDVASSVHSGAISQVGVKESKDYAKGELSTFDRTDEVSEEGAKVLKEQAKAKSLESQDLPNMHVGEGINLMPILTKEEQKTEKRKLSVNIFSALAILVVVFVSLMILGTNLGMKLWLNNEKKQLSQLENELYSQSEVIRANNEILTRFDLYSDVQEATFSNREVLIYWRDLFSDFGSLSTIELSGGLNFQVDGGTDTLKQVAFLWHLLTTDPRVRSGNLDSFSKGEDTASFSFEGDLNYEYFKNKKAEEKKQELEGQQQLEDQEEEVEQDPAESEI